MIEKCAQTIENVIIPALGEETLILQARYAAAILYALAPGVEEKSKELIEENRLMKEVLGKVRRTLDRKTSYSNEVSAQLMEALALELKDVVCTDVLEENHRLKQVLADAIQALDALADKLPPEKMVLLKHEVRIALRQQLNHALGRVSNFLPKV